MYYHLQPLPQGDRRSAHARRLQWLVAIIAAAGLQGCAHPIPAECAAKAAYPTPVSLCGQVSAQLASSSLASTANGKKPAAAPRKGDKVTLPELVAELVRSNPEIGIAGAREKEQFASVDAAKAAWWPTINGSASAGPQRVLDPSPEQDMVRKDASLSITQTLYDFGVTANDVKRARKAHESATSSRIAKTEETAFAMMDAYLKVLQADEMIAVTRESMEAHQRILALVQLSQQNGNATVADTKRITTRLEGAKSAMIDLTTARSDAADAFKNIAGIDVDRIDGNHYQTLDGDPLTLDGKTLEQNPAMVAAAHEIESLKYQLAALKAGKMPVIGLNGMVKTALNMSSSESSDKSSTAYMLATVQVPLFDGGLNRSRQDQVLARIDEATLKMEKLRRELLQAAKNTGRAVATDSDKSSALGARVDAAKKVADLSFEQFKNGGKSVFELLDSQSEYFKAKDDLIEQKFNRRKAQIFALQLRGKLVESLVKLSSGSAGPASNQQAASAAASNATALPGVKF